MRIWISILVLSVSGFAFADNISIDDIRSWAKKRLETANGLDFFDSEQIRQVGLINREIAYLVPVSLNHEGRNNIFQMALALPSRKEVVLFTGTEIKSIDQVLDENHDGISEIFANNSSSGQGKEIGEKSIVQIDNNGKIIVLRKVKFETNEGVWGKKVASYYQKNVSWMFANSNMGDGIKDLVETIIIEKGVDNCDPKIEKTINRYHFINTYFVEYEPVM